MKFCIIILLDILSLDLKIPLSSSNFTFHYDPATCLCQDTRYNRYYFSITEKKPQNLKLKHGDEKISPLPGIEPRPLCSVQVWSI